MKPLLPAIGVHSPNLHLAHLLIRDMIAGYDGVPHRNLHSSMIAPWLPIFVQPRRGVFVSDEVRIRVLRLPQTEGRSDETTLGEGLSQKTFPGS